VRTIPSHMTNAKKTKQALHLTNVWREQLLVWLQ
jgi:hypothetical protein